MRPTTYRRVLVAAPLVLALAAVACNRAPAARSDSPQDAVTGAGDEVLATVGDVEITRSDAEEAFTTQLLDLERKQRRLLEQGLDRAIEQSLLEQEARSQGEGVDDLLAREVDAAVTAPTEADVDAYYEQNRERMPPSKEQIAPRISDYLAGLRKTEARQSYVARLRDRYPVERLLQPDRVDVRAGDGPSRGPTGAPVTIVEFSDFQCPFCQRAVPTVKKIVEDYPEQVRLVFRQFPLRSHPQARKAAEASLCAAGQGKFWEMHDAMFEDRGQLAVAQLKLKAADLGLDADAFAECLDSGATASAVESDLAEGERVGVTGTPAFFINGRLVSGAVPYGRITAVIDDELQRLGQPVPVQPPVADEGA